MTDTGNNRIRRVTLDGLHLSVFSFDDVVCYVLIDSGLPAGTVVTVAGSGKEGHVDADGELAFFSRPTQICIDPSSGAYLVSDNHSIRMVTPQGTVSTLAGANVAGYAEGKGPEARFKNVAGLTVDPTTNAILVCDSGMRYAAVVLPHCRQVEV